eukprot:17382-Heterococcus_DN1.PRE.2
MEEASEKPKKAQKAAKVDSSKPLRAFKAQQRTTDLKHAIRFEMPAEVVAALEAAANAPANAADTDPQYTIAFEGDQVVFTVAGKSYALDVQKESQSIQLYEAVPDERSGAAEPLKLQQIGMVGCKLLSKEHPADPTRQQVAKDNTQEARKEAAKAKAQDWSEALVDTMPPLPP